MPPLRRVAALLAAVWVGMLIGTAAFGTPAGFALAPRELAGKLAGFMLEREATASLVLALVMLILLRAGRAPQEAGPAPRAMSAEVLLVLGALFCTLFGHYGLQPSLAAARAGEGALSFGQLHAVSVAFFGLKALLLAALAWRLSAPA